MCYWGVVYFLLVSREGVQREQTTLFYPCQGLGADSAELGNLVIALQCGLGQVAFPLWVDVSSSETWRAGFDYFSASPPLFCWWGAGNMTWWGLRGSLPVSFWNWEREGWKRSRGVKSAFAVTSCANREAFPDFFKPQSSSPVEREEADGLQRIFARMKGDVEPRELSVGLVWLEHSTDGDRHYTCLFLSWPDPSAVKVTGTVPSPILYWAD